MTHTLTYVVIQHYMVQCTAIVIVYIVHVHPVFVKHDQLPSIPMSCCFQN